MPNTLDFELICFYDHLADLYRYYWINRHGIISSPYFDDENAANTFIRKTISAIENKKEHEVK